MRNNSVGAAIGLATMCALGIATATPAIAQTAAQTTPAADDELVDVGVTARRVEERSQDVPISIQVFNQEQLAQHNLVNAADLALYTPSLSANPNFGTANSTFAIRGFVQDADTAPSVATYSPTWLIDLDYKPIEDVLVYGKYARGYRAGGVYANSPSNYRTWQPEKVDSFETGFKSTFTNVVRGTFDLAAFYNDFRDQQLQVGFDAAPGVNVAPTTGIANVGKSRIYGAEVEASIEPVKALRFTFDYTYLKTEIISIAPLVSADPHYVVAESISAGDPLVLSPRNKFALSASYALPLTPDIGKITVGTTFTHTDRQLANYDYLNQPNIIALNGGDFGTLGSRDLLDLNATWQSIFGSPVDLSLFGTNVTDKHYYTIYAGLGGAGPGGTPQVGFETGAVGTPRIYGARLRYRFGTSR